VTVQVFKPNKGQGSSKKNEPRIKDGEKKSKQSREENAVAGSSIHEN
jgi:hypothetical protein